MELNRILKEHNIEMELICDKLVETYNIAANARFVLCCIVWHEVYCYSLCLHTVRSYTYVIFRYSMECLLLMDGNF